MRVVVDAGPVIHLSWIDRLDLLERLFAEVFLPPAVRDEVLAPPPGTLGLERIQRALAEGWLQVRASARWPQPRLGAPSSLAAGETEALLRLREAWALDVQQGSLAAGETEALLPAEEIGADFVLTDDAAARATARRGGLDVMGTVGVLIEAREQGLIPAATPLLLELRRLGQWLSEDLLQAVQREESGTPS